MKIGFLFPGQGSQTVGMGKDLYDEYEEYRNLYNEVEGLIGINIKNLTFNSTEEILGETKNTQICILTMSLAILKLLEKEGIKADASMGLSLGEYAALINSKVISFEEGVKIVKTRGELMQKLCPTGEWSMAAILGLDEENVKKVCLKVSSGFVEPVNFNCPGQIVISGEKHAVSEAVQIAKENGAKKVIELKTSGPFHTQKLNAASNALKEELDRISINNFDSIVIKNLDGKEYSNSDDVKDILAKHIVNPVRFEKGIQSMLDMGIDTFVEIGPGKALSGFVKRTSKDVKILNINSVDSFKTTIEELKK